MMRFALLSGKSTGAARKSAKKRVTLGDAARLEAAVKTGVAQAFATADVTDEAATLSALATLGATQPFDIVVANAGGAETIWPIEGEWAARRQEALSRRVSRISNLLRTRVEIEQQRSSRELLDAMNRRQKAQLLLQSAVEGLSVAAVTYYGAGLVGYAAKGAKSLGWNVSPDLAVALAIPLIALAVWLGVRRLHAQAHAAADTHGEH